jgi:tetratricopeptide (TPR) repeat protein
MRLRLHYNERPCHAVAAAFLRGDAPEGWLREISRWGVEARQLECYPVPESIHSVKPAGLLVIFRGPNPAVPAGLLHPYGCLAGRLYLPVHATLCPEVAPAELQDLLLWERQLFHPTVGLVGFSAADRLDLADLLTLPPPTTTDWGRAHPGLPAKPPLGEIDVRQPTLEEVMASFKELVDPKDLQDILDAEEEKSSLVRDLFTNLNGGLLNGALSVLQKIKDVWPSGNGNPDRNDTGQAGPPGAGPFDKLENWLRENLEEIQRKRSNEIQRLLNLFDQDTDEALKYAIPLDSPYQNRGSSAPTSRLPQHPTDFDLGKLGGGGVTDTWSLDARYYELRRKYQEAARKEIEAGNAKKAAYIYAHLLGDFYAAARVLEGGKHYREAAALYKDHLRNVAAAAECLERGGLLLEAIPLYEQAHKHERAGDLYHAVGQAGPAADAYEKSLANVLRNGDYLDASRLLTDKLAQPDRARQTLLEGWKSSAQAEPCLKRYFDLVAGDDAGQLGPQVRELFAQPMAAPKKAQFLNALVHVHEGHPHPDLTETATEVAYQVVSEQVQEGNLSQLPVLKKFVPDDYLLPSDVSRFTSLRRTAPRQAAGTPALQLDKTIRWVSTVAHRNQFVALGLRDGRLHLARGDWYGNFEYYAWPQPVAGNSSWSLVADPYYSNRITVLAALDVALEEKRLPRNKYFDEELVVNGAYGLTKGLVGLTANGEGGVSMLKAHNYALTLYHYQPDGSLRGSVDCRFAGDRPFRPAAVMTPVPSPTGMLYRNGHYYAYRGSALVKIGEDGAAEGIDVGGMIGQVAATTHHARLRLALLTENGCLLLRHLQGHLRAGSDFFAQDLAPARLGFVSANHLVVAGKTRAQVFLVGEDAIQPRQAYQTRTPIVAALTTADRHQWALLEENGRITVWPVEE